MPKIDVAAAPVREGTGYPPPYNQPCLKRRFRMLSAAAGLGKIGVNLLTLPDGQWSSQRHWHDDEDEFIWILSGEVVLVDDSGETLLRAGDCAAFPAGEKNGHHLKNRSGKDAVILQVSNATNEATEWVDYPDIDMCIRPGGDGFRHKDGRPYAKA